MDFEGAQGAIQRHEETRGPVRDFLFNIAISSELPVLCCIQMFPFANTMMFSSNRGWSQCVMVDVSLDHRFWCIWYLRQRFESRFHSFCKVSLFMLLLWSVVGLNMFIPVVSWWPVIWKPLPCVEFGKPALERLTFHIPCHVFPCFCRGCVKVRCWVLDMGCADFVFMSSLIHSGLEFRFLVPFGV